MADEHTPGHDEHSHDAIFLKVFLVLCGCTVLSFAADFLPNLHVGDGVVGTIVLAIAVAKALCVMLFFMHLKWEQNWKFVVLAPTVILSVGLCLALVPDIGLHYYSVQSTETREAATAAAAASAAAHADNGQAEKDGR
ncbi:MAG: oxidase [Planctomycetaceae bacterium]|jgi:cytochrome c oxidase subunit 4|nr:oxidase [Planctomycetaceae bacterium]MDP7277819.1 cytochrome C oxidase subunit IV family protein [Planctomycetaceae bacterium]